MSKNLRGKSLRKSKFKEDFNPVEGILNIADLMLVFACGLMMALIVNWNVNMDFQTEKVDLQIDQEVKEMEDLQNNPQKALEKDNGYKKMGILYQDPQTGKMYMLTEE